jgi:hypothetical protein
MSIRCHFISNLISYISRVFKATTLVAKKYLALAKKYLAIFLAIFHVASFLNLSNRLSLDNNWTYSKLCGDLKGTFYIDPG